MAAIATYLGGKSLGAGLPFLLPIGASLNGIVGLSLPDIQARLSGALSASIQIIPPGFELATSIAFALQFTPPAISVSIMASLIAELTLALGELQLALQLAIQFTNLMATVGLHFYMLEGGIGSMGSALQGVLGGGMPGGSGPDQAGIACMILAGDNGAITALRTLFGIGPAL